MVGGRSGIKKFYLVCLEMAKGTGGSDQSPIIVFPSRALTRRIHGNSKKACRKNRAYGRQNQFN